MKQYLDLLQDILDNGTDQTDRTGVGSRNVFGRQMRFDLTQGFPLLTTKKLHIRSIVYELLWFLNGDTNIKYLNDNGVKIWDEWADENGDLGPIYGEQWRGGKDQIAKLIETLKVNPYCRRSVVSAWNVSEIENMALPPCHCLFQFYVMGNQLSCHLYQRSADTFLGVPFNITSYALLTEMIAQQTGLEVGEFVWTGGVVHLYHNHLEQTRLQLTRTPKKLPVLRIKRKPVNISSYVFDDFEILNYEADPTIKAPIAV